MMASKSIRQAPRIRARLQACRNELAKIRLQALRWSRIEKDTQVLPPAPCYSFVAIQHLIYGPSRLDS